MMEGDALQYREYINDRLYFRNAMPFCLLPVELLEEVTPDFLSNRLLKHVSRKCRGTASRFSRF